MIMKFCQCKTFYLPSQFAKYTHFVYLTQYEREIKWIVRWCIGILDAPLYVTNENDQFDILVWKTEMNRMHQIDPYKNLDRKTKKRNQNEPILLMTFQNRKSTCSCESKIEVNHLKFLSSANTITCFQKDLEMNQFLFWFLLFN